MNNRPWRNLVLLLQHISENYAHSLCFDGVEKWLIWPISFRVINFWPNEHCIEIAKFMGPTWGPPGSCPPQMGPMLAHEPCFQGMPGKWLVLPLEYIPGIMYIVHALLCFVIGIDTNIEVIVVSLTTWEAHHSPRAKGCGELPRSLMRQQWPQYWYQFLFYHDETKLMMNK